MDLTFTIRQMTLADYPKALALWDTFSWGESIQEAKPNFSIDPTGFFIGELNTEVIGTITAVKFGNYAHIGYYCIKQEFQGNGYGLKLLNHALDYLKDVKVIGLDAEADTIKLYEKHGFKIYTKGLNFFRVAQGVYGKNLINLRNEFLEQVVEYDTDRFGDCRKSLMESLLQEEGYHGVAVIKDNRVKGYGFLRRINEIYKVAPFLADDREAAEELLDGLQSLVLNQSIFIDIYETSPDLQGIMRIQQWTQIVEFYRMYAKGTPKIDLTKPYASTIGIG